MNYDLKQYTANQIRSKSWLKIRDILPCMGAQPKCDKLNG